MDTNPEKTLEIVRNRLHQFATVSDSDWNFFSSKLRKQVIPKKTTFLKMGKIENHISFMISGLVRFYIPHVDSAKEVTFGFSFKEQFISAYDSFLTRKPSSYELETLTKSVILSITYNDLQEVYKTTQIGNLIGRLAAERLFLLKSKREQKLLQFTAKERYLNLFKDHPEIIKEIPLKYISSYIGVTPQGLSRIRKEIS